MGASGAVLGAFLKDFRGSEGRSSSFLGSSWCLEDRLGMLFGRLGIKFGVLGVRMAS